MHVCGTTTLIERIRRDGGADDWAELVRRYWRVVFGYARRHSLGPEDAEDFTQDILSELTRALPGFELDRSKGTFRSFLFTMVRRRLIDRGRAEKRLARPGHSTEKRSSSLMHLGKRSGGGGAALRVERRIEDELSRTVVSDVLQRDERQGA